MAGIGFELRKIYNGIAFFQNKRPTLMLELCIPVLCFWGFYLQLVFVVLTMVGESSENERDYILSNWTYAIIFSLVITSLFSLVVTRFVADMLYEKKFETIIPSFYASGALMLIDWDTTICALSSLG